MRASTTHLASPSQRVVELESERQAAFGHLCPGYGAMRFAERGGRNGLAALAHQHTAHGSGHLPDGRPFLAQRGARLWPCASCGGRACCLPPLKSLLPSASRTPLFCCFFPLVPGCPFSVSHQLPFLCLYLCEGCWGFFCLHLTFSLLPTSDDRAPCACSRGLGPSSRGITLAGGSSSSERLVLIF